MWVLYIAETSISGRKRPSEGALSCRNANMRHGRSTEDAAFSAHAGRKLKLAAGFDGATQRDLVGVFQVAANGEAAGKPRNLHAQRLDELG